MSLFAALYRKLLLLIIGCCASTLLYGQQDIKYRNYTVDNGLPHNVCFEMYQDSKGYLWVGTDNGLGRFDGTAWKHYNTEDGLSSPFPIIMQEDSNQNLWVSTWKGGFDVVQGDSITNTDVLNGDNKVNGFQFLDRQTILTWNFSLFRQRSKQANNQWKTSPVHNIVFSKKKQEIIFKTDNTDLSDQSFLYYTTHEVAAQAISQNRTLIFGDFPGVYQAKKGLKLEHFFHATKADSVYAVFEANDQVFWFACRQKIYSSDATGRLRSFTKGLPNKRIYSISVVANKYAYLIMGDLRYKNCKLYYYDLATGECLNVSQLLNIDSDPSHMTQDTEHNVWVGTDGAGLYCFYPSLFKHYSKAEGLTNTFTNVIKSDGKGNTWIGTKTGIFSFKNGHFQEEKIYAQNSRRPQNTFNTITDIIITPNAEQDLLANSINTGLQFKNNRFILQDRLGGGDRAMEDKQGYLLLQIGINILKTFNSIKALDAYEIDYNEFCYKCHTYKFSGEIQFGEIYNNTKRVLFFLEYLPNEKQRLYRFNDEYEKELIIADFPSKRMNIIYQDKQQNIWVGTDNGLFQLTRMGEDSYTLTNHYTENNGLISKRCRKLLMDHHGLLWIGTPYGLMYFDGERFTAYTTRSGLLDNGVSALNIDHTNTLWVGGVNGVSTLDISKPPAIIKAPVAAPPLHLEQVEVNGKKISLEELSTAFPYNTALSFHFKGISFSYPEKLHYQYRLNQGEWISTPSNTLTFSALQPNEYHLEMRIKTLNSDWSQAKTINFELLAPWWLTWWALSSYVIASSLLLLGGFSIQRKRLKKKEARRAHINKIFTELELKALQAQMNPHFIFNALNSIQGFILDSDELKASDYLSSFSHLMRMYLESSKSKYISVAQEVKLLELYMELEGLRFGDRLSLSIIADPAIVNEDYKIPGMLVQPYVENAINHGLAYKEGTGLLTVSFTKDEGHICCVVEDDGVGREKALAVRQKMKKQHRSRAMQIVDERLSALNSIDGIEVRINIVDKKNEQNEGIGTKVIIQFPLIKQIPNSPQV